MMQSALLSHEFSPVFHNQMPHENSETKTYLKKLEQGSSNLSLEVQSAAEFSSSPDQTHLPVRVRAKLCRNGPDFNYLILAENLENENVFIFGIKDTNKLFTICFTFYKK